MLFFPYMYDGIAFGMHLEFAMTSERQSSNWSEIDRSQLLHLLSQHFNQEELKTLCFELNVDFDNLGGDSKESKVRELVAWCERTNRITELITTCKNKRPLIDWNSFLQNLEDVRPPFMGLRHFEVSDADIFFGRDTLISTLVQHLHENNFLAIIGASGSGKSSLVRAGLVPALMHKRELPAGTTALNESKSWQFHLITPTARPLEALATSLTRDQESVTATATLIEDMTNSPRGLHLYAHKLLYESQAKRLVLIVDQFEELFTLCQSELERELFINNLSTAIEPGVGNPTTLIIALRADFYQYCAQFSRLREALETKQKYIGQMNADELRLAIEEPAHHLGYTLESGLVDLLLKEMGEEPGVLPLLSHALLETWKRREGRALTFASYAKSGGIHKAIGKTADNVFDSLQKEEQLIAQNIFLQLTELGEGTQDTRRRIAINELIPKSRSGDDIKSVLKVLADARLITVDADTVEVAHEALVREWPKLRTWLDSNREDLRLRRRFTTAANEWDKNNRDQSYLYHGVRLSEIEERYRARSGELNHIERDFLHSSLARQAQQKREQEEQLHRAEQLRLEKQASGRLRRLTVGLVIFLVFAVVASLYALNQRADAINAKIVAEEEASARATQEAIANENAIIVSTRAAESEAAKAEVERLNRVIRAEELAAKAQIALENSPRQGLLLALESLNITEVNNQPPQPSAQNSFRQALASVGGLPIGNPDDVILTSVFSSNGRWLVTISQSWFSRKGSTVSLWDMTKNDPGVNSVVLYRDGESIFRTINFSSDDKWLVGIDAEGSTLLWDLAEIASETQPLVIQGNSDEIDYTALSPSAHWLVTVNSNGVATLQTLNQPDNSSSIIPLSGYEEPISYTRFNSSEEWLATVHNNGDIRVWNLNAIDPALGSELIPWERYMSQEDSIVELSFSPNGGWLVVGVRREFEYFVHLWRLSNLSQSTEPLTLDFDFFGSLDDIQFSPDSSWLITSESFGFVLWDLTLPNFANNPISFHGEAIAFSPDGFWLATEDGIWDLAELHSIDEPMVPLEFEHPIESLSYSPDGRWLAGKGGTDITLWRLNLTTSRQLNMVLLEYDLLVKPVYLTGIEASVASLKFSPHSNWLLTTTERDFDEPTIGPSHLWKLVTFDPTANPIIVANHDWIVHDVAFSSDNRWFASFDGSTVQLWDWEISESITYPIVLSNYANSSPASLAFSSNNNWIGATSENTVQLWNLQNDDPVANSFLLPDHEQFVHKLAFSPDNQWVATYSEDKIRLWDLASINLLDSIEPGVLRLGYESSFGDIWFSHDSRWLVLSDHSTRLWRNIDAEHSSFESFTLSGHASGIMSISHNSRWIATTVDKDTYIWGLANSKPTVDPIILKNQRGGVFSPDGSWLATIGEDSVNLLGWKDGELTNNDLSFAGYGESGLDNILFSPDSRWIAATQWDKVYIWAIIDSSLAPITLVSGSAINAIAFSPDGEWLATANNDNARLWRIELDDLVTIGCRVAGRNFTYQEWEQYFPDEEYRKTCPDLPIHPSFVNNILNFGRSLARDGNILGAITQFEKAIEVNPNIDIDPEKYAKQLAVEALMEEGERLAKAGEIERAIAIFEEALELNPELDMVPETEAKRIAAESLMEEGERLARAGEIERAIAIFEEALELDSELDIVSEIEAKRIAAEALMEEGNEFARTGEVDRAITLYEEALELNLNLSIDPEIQAGELAAPFFVGESFDLVQQGHVAEAIAAYDRAQMLDPNLEISAGFLNGLCWFGSLWGQAANVIGYCDQAVELNGEEDGTIHDSRGVARALLGDLVGAIEDFQIFINWARGRDRFEVYIPQREEWILALEEERNPFDNETLEELRNE
ncbi:MAG: tetratricopeptide repeat protein [Anaerolineaceae bacterium]|nr:tetratricopeptide repeat protein [Anaerolineaceae bacterium]